MAEITNPHDHFFKDMFSRPELAADFLQSYLPPEVATLLDPDPAAIELTKDSFVDPGLRPHYADLLYRVRLGDGRAAFVYVLAEHKSYPFALVALQLLGYMVAIWQHQERSKPGSPLAPIIPIVLYHGRRAWKVAPGFGALFAGPAALQPYWPDFRYELADVSLGRQAEVQGRAALRLTLLVLRHVYDTRLSEHLPGILTLVIKLPDPATATEFLAAITGYLSQAVPEMTEEKVDEAIKAAFADPGDETVTTILETWLQERWQQGVQQGVQQGLEQGERAGLLAGIELALELKFGSVGLDLMPEVRAIDDVATLHAVHEAIRTAPTPAEVRAAYSFPPATNPPG
jgi:predicted transposase/invertase (TIGR01784 family)